MVRSIVQVFKEQGSFRAAYPRPPRHVWDHGLAVIVVLLRWIALVPLAISEAIYTRHERRQ